MAGGSGSPDYEVQRILKAFADAQWLADLDERLAAYQAHLAQADASGDECQAAHVANFCVT